MRWCSVYIKGGGVFILPFCYKPGCILKGLNILLRLIADGSDVSPDRSHHVIPRFDAKGHLFVPRGRNVWLKTKHIFNTRPFDAVYSLFRVKFYHYYEFWNVREMIPIPVENNSWLIDRKSQSFQNRDKDCDRGIWAHVHTENNSVA